MNKFRGVGFSLSIVFLITAGLSTLPIEATIILQRQNSQIKNNSQYLTLSWGDILNSLSRHKPPKGSRGQIKICAVLPQGLVNLDTNQQGSQEIWSNKPLFLWRITGAKAKKIDIFEKGKRDVFESLEIKEGETRVIYNGKPFQPGKSYTWQLSAQIPRGPSIKDSGSDFQVMEAEKRRSLTDHLTKLEATLKQQGASVEKIALEKANYFAQQEMWSDALQQLYSVPNPSPQLIETMKNIEAHNFCADERAKVSVLP